MKTHQLCILVPIAVMVAMGGMFNIADAQAPADKQTEYFLFLTTGKSAEGVPKDELQAKQVAHVGNFGALAKENKLSLAGPLSDPKNFLRGIIMVTAPDVASMEKYFDADPYVKEGFMKLEVNPVRERIGEPVVIIKPEGLEELRIVVWDYATQDKKRREIPEQSQAAHVKYWKQIEEQGRVGLICRFGDGATRFGIAIIDSIPDKQIEEWLGADPLIAQKLITYQMMPQYLSKGALAFPARK